MFTLRMLPVLGMLLCPTVRPATAEEFAFETPKTWQAERIELPPAFAKDMTLRGVEELRFSPGMFDADADDFFTYVFVLSIDPKQTVTQQDLQSELRLYYQGLAQAVMKASDEDVAKYTLQLNKRDDIQRAPAGATNLAVYDATLSWVEPFTTRESQRLNLEIQVFRLPDSDRTFVFVCASPQKDDHRVWGQMREIRQTMEVTDG